MIEKKKAIELANERSALKQKLVKKREADAKKWRE
jgi:hypothetical protein